MMTDAERASFRLNATFNFQSSHPSILIHFILFPLQSRRQSNGTIHWTFSRFSYHDSFHLDSLSTTSRGSLSRPSLSRLPLLLADVGRRSWKQARDMREEVRNLSNCRLSCLASRHSHLSLRVPQIGERYHKQTR